MSFFNCLKISLNLYQYSNEYNKSFNTELFIRRAVMLCIKRQVNSYVMSQSKI